MIKKIVTDKSLLRLKSEKSEINERSVAVGENLKDTLVGTWSSLTKGFAIAAPQIAEFERIIAVANDGENPDGIEIMFNPVITEKAGRQVFWEKCLSGPLEMSRVERPYRVKVEYFDSGKNKKAVVGEGMNAIVLCHEIDHLDGIICQDIAEKNVVSETYEESARLKVQLRTDEPLLVLDKEGLW